MDTLEFNIIVSILLVPINLFCSFWIFKEALNQAGVTFGEALRHFSNKPLVGTSRTRLQKNQRRIFHYLAEKAEDPEQIRKLLRWYGISTLPGLAALILAEFGIIIPFANKEQYIFVGNIVLILINIVLVVVGKVYKQNHPMEERMVEKLAIKREKEKSKHRGKQIVVCTVVGGIFLSFFIAIHLAVVELINPKTTSIQPPSITGNLHFSDVHTALSDRGFETANIATTYWFYDEHKLTNVVAGVKGETTFEFYEYSDGETTDGVYNRISYDIAPELEFDQRVEYETELPGGGKQFAITQNGVYSLVLYQNNTVIYACSSDHPDEIQDILDSLGYLTENTAG